MTTELYLDTARLGRMCHGAYHAERDFAKLVSQHGFALYFEEFLRSGFGALPEPYRRQLPGLECWTGVSGLKDNLKSLLSAPIESQILFSDESRTPILLAAECLFRQCGVVLTTDLEWAPYIKVLRDTARRHNRRLVVVRLWRRLLAESLDADDVRRIIRSQFHANQCDGLLLSDITSTGIRVPIDQLLNDLASVARFVVIDGAQAINHRPVTLNDLPCDIYLAGMHKWLRAYHPLRAVVIRRRTGQVLRIMRAAARNGQLLDPLLEFVQQTEQGRSHATGATVNLTGLFTGAGAMNYWNNLESSVASRWKGLLHNRAAVLNCLAGYAGSAFHPSLASGALLLTLRHGRRRQAKMRDGLLSEGIQATVARGQFLRLSLPHHSMRWAAHSQILRAIDRGTSDSAGPPWATAKSSHRPNSNQDSDGWKSEPPFPNRLTRRLSREKRRDPGEVS